MFNKLTIILILLLVILSGCQKQTQEANFLDSIVNNNQLKLGKTELNIQFQQKLDHEDPNSEIFPQQIYLRHVDFKKPVVFVTEGYGARERTVSEITRLLECNQIIVEHRYFNKSRPEKLKWKYMTLEQSVKDLHAIVLYFKQFYQGKWINTGISKGGQTTLLHRYSFPEDVDISVPYVAPLNLSMEDERIYDFIDNKVSTPEAREAVTAFQRTLLERRKEIIPLLKNYAKQKQYTFEMNGMDTAYEYIVLEVSFAYWQWGNGKYQDLPKNDATAKELFNALKGTNSISFFDDKSRIDDPFMYQAYYQMGLYGYKTKKFKDLLLHIKDDIASNKVYVSQDVPRFNGEIMNNMADWLKESGNNILYIYGEFDCWSSTAVDIGSKTNALKMVLKGGNHGTRIRSFKGEELEKIYSTLEKWSGQKIKRKKKKK